MHFQKKKKKHYKIKKRTTDFEENFELSKERTNLR